MNSKLLNFLVVLACATFMGLGAVRAQNPATGSSGNASAISAPSPQTEAAPNRPASTPNANDARRASTASDTRDAANTAVANDRGTVAANQSAPSEFHVGWIGLVGLFGLLGLLGVVRRGSARSPVRKKLLV